MTKTPRPAATTQDRPPGLPADAAALAERVEEIALAERDDAARRAQVLDALRLYLAKHRATAETRLLAGGAEAGVRIAWDLSAATDAVVVALWQFAWRHILMSANPTEGERMSLVAVGGYGRAVLAPFSDLDLLFLRPWKENATSESLTEFMLYALWDLGFKVGHASRTVTDCLKLARADMTIRTATLEARHLAGDEKLFNELKKRFAREVVRGTAKEFVAAKLDERDRRHAKAGASRYLVEPNVKDGKGGLRDLHTLYWIACYLDPTTPRGDKALDDLLTPKDRRTLAQAFNFLWAVRANMHFVAGRAEERLSFDLQPEIAKRMGWRGRADESAVERFMRRYFLIAKDVGALTRAFCAKLEQDGSKTARGLSRLLRARPKRRKLDDPAFVEEDGRLTLANAKVFEDDPSALLRLFRTADRDDLDLHPDAFTAVSRSLNLVTPKFRRDPKVAEIFLDILARGSRPGRTLQLMNDAGLLGRFLPEFARIVGQTQLNRHHAYTVDEHTLRAIGIIGDIDNGRLSEDHPLSASIMPVIADKEALYLAMLMHDTGKGGTRGQEDDGSIAARRACDRLGLAHPKAELTAWLVRHHLVMSDYAQKRDVSDPDTVAAFARIVETPERLRLLLVLTTADIRAVGPGVWNDWKGQLLRELYAATEAALRGGRGADPATAFRKRAEAEAVAAREALVREDPNAVAFAQAMEDSYFTTTPIAEQKAHAELVRATETSGAAAFTRYHKDRSALELTVATKDRIGLFADLTERLSGLGAQVVGARLFTSQRDMALDVFYLQDATGAPWGRNHPAELGRLKREIESAAKEGTPRPRREAEKPWKSTASADLTPTVVVDNDATDAATIVEVSGKDRAGLLASLARRFAAAGLSVQSAHIENYGLRAVDAFYVLTEAGEKLTDPKAIEALKAELQGVFTPARAVA